MQIVSHVFHVLLLFLFVPLSLSAPVAQHSVQSTSTLEARGGVNILNTISTQGLLDGLDLGQLLGLLKGVLPAELLDLLKNALKPVEGLPIVGDLLGDLLGGLLGNLTTTHAPVTPAGIVKNALNVAQLQAINSVLQTMTLAIGSPTHAASQLQPAATGLAANVLPPNVVNALGVAPVDPLAIAHGVAANGPANPFATVGGLTGMAPFSAVRGVANVAPVPINALNGALPGMVTAAAVPATAALSSITGAVDPNAPAVSQPGNIAAAAIPAASGAIPASELVGDRLVPVVNGAGLPTGVATNAIGSVKDKAPVQPTSIVAIVKSGPTGVADAVLATAPVPVPTENIKQATAMAAGAAPAPVKDTTGQLPTNVAMDALNSATGVPKGAAAAVPGTAAGTLNSLTGGAVPLPGLW